MPAISVSAEQVQKKASARTHRNGDQAVLSVMEGLLLALICLSPWCFGAVHPSFELLLYAGIATLLMLWAVRILLNGEFSWRKCPIALCLAAIFIVAVAQLVPWPKGWLSWLSPRTAELYALLLPSQNEILPSPNGGEMVGSNAVGSTLSLAPGATQREAIRLLAIFLLFVVVRNNLTSTAQLRRLSIVALTNGLLLSLFAIVQFFTWGPHLIYGVYPTAGTIFGPFICRNHFPYYVNMCLGLGAGLLLFSLGSSSTSRRRPHHSSSHHSSSRHSSSGEERMEVPTSAKIVEAASLQPTRRSSEEKKMEGAANEKTEESSSRHHKRRSSRRSKGSSKEKESIQYESADDESEDWLSLLGGVLREPRTLWLGFVLAVLAASIVFSVSRGGTLALLGAALVCALIQSRRSTSFLRLGIGTLLIGFVATGFVAWFGLDQLEERWYELYETTSETKDLSKVDRLALWSANLAGVQEFPVWGTGYGTFQFAELLHRSDPKQEGIFAQHAHNDYLEALLEGGILGMIPLLLLVGTLLLFGYRAVRRQHRSSAGWLATGVLFGLIAVLIHSFVDFGLHIPAIAFFATVLCAHLAALGSRGRESSRHADSSPPQGEVSEEAPSFQCRGLASIAVAAVLGLFALVLVQQGWKEHKAERLRDAALALSAGVDHPDREMQIAYLQAAVQETPKAPILCVELARVQMARYWEEGVKERDSAMPLEVEQGMSSLAAAMSFPAGFSPAAVCATALFAQAEWSRGEIERKLNVPLLMPALRSYLRARDNCPIMTEPHTRLAASADKMIRGDSTAAYLDRARFLSPANAYIWYLCGKQEFQTKRRQQAYKSWKRSLELSDMHLPVILDFVRPVLSDEEILDRVLPDKPKVLFVAAMNLHADEVAREKQKPFLERALTVLVEQPEPSKLEEQAEDLFLKAMIHDILGQKKDAIAAFQAALVHAPKSREIDWRLSLARLLYEDGQLHEASRQLNAVLSLRPSHGQAKEMLKMVRKEMAKKM
ncbi:MAG: O-antigen ligase family protein [Gemmataceae bacterium]